MFSFIGKKNYLSFATTDLCMLLHLLFLSTSSLGASPTYSPPSIPSPYAIPKPKKERIFSPPTFSTNLSSHCPFSYAFIWWRWGEIKRLLVVLLLLLFPSPLLLLIVVIIPKDNLGRFLLHVPLRTKSPIQLMFLLLHRRAKLQQFGGHWLLRLS